MYPSINCSLEIVKLIGDSSIFSAGKISEISQTVSQLLSDKHQLSDWAKKDIFVPTETEKLKDLVEEAVIRLKSKVVKLKIEKMLEQMKSAEFTSDERVKLINDFQKLTRLSNHIGKKLGREC